MYSLLVYEPITKRTWGKARPRKTRSGFEYDSLISYDGLENNLSRCADGAWVIDKTPCLAPELQQENVTRIWDQYFAELTLAMPEVSPEAPELGWILNPERGHSVNAFALSSIKSSLRILVQDEPLRVSAVAEWLKRPDNVLRLTVVGFGVYAHLWAAAGARIGRVQVYGENHSRMVVWLDGLYSS